MPGPVCCLPTKDKSGTLHGPSLTRKNQPETGKRSTPVSILVPGRDGRGHLPNATTTTRKNWKNSS